MIEVALRQRESEGAPEPELPAGLLPSRGTVVAHIGGVLALGVNNIALMMVAKRCKPCPAMPLPGLSPRRAVSRFTGWIAEHRRAVRRTSDRLDACGLGARRAINRFTWKSNWWRLTDWDSCATSAKHWPHEAKCRGCQFDVAREHRVNAFYA